MQNVIYDVLRERPGWAEAEPGSDWAFIWSDRCGIQEIYDNQYLEEHVRLNHFRNHYELTRKNLMAKNLKRLKKQIEREQGKGIFLFKKLKDITDWRREDYYRSLGEKKDDKEIPEAYIVQRYIDNPLLIGGKKFDLRVYVLVSSYVPLKAWLYREGFARFTNTRYSLDSIDDNYIHLTNVAIQKNAPDYDPDGSKWSIHQLRLFLQAKNGSAAVEDLFRQMDEIFIKSLQSVQRVMINDKHCFELYGYDILIDSELKPWLCEINASPSLTASNQTDYDLKYAMLNDVLSVLDIDGRITGKEKRVGGFDLMWNDGPVSREDITFADSGAPNTNLSSNTFLGCCNTDREIQLKQTFQTAQQMRKTFF